MIHFCFRFADHSVTDKFGKLQDLGALQIKFLILRNQSGNFSDMP